MRCPHCNSDNPAEVKFCGECGAAMIARCASCGAENPPRFKFCGQCGAALTASPAPELAAPAAARPADHRELERRHLTVLFSDLVDSTAIAARLDPEEWREVAADYQRAASDAVVRFGGHVAQYLGDGLIAYFGYPRAVGNDSEAAVRAGLAIVDGVAGLNLKLAERGGLSLSVRVGIDAGPVVVGPGGGKGADVYGDTPNVAARVQALAEAQTVLITAAVEQLVGGRFVLEDRGLQRLKGVANPVHIHKVVRAASETARLQPPAGRELASFVGREEEIQLLMGRWRRVCDGEGQAVFIVGEPGIGKSRLLHQFRAAIRSSPHTWIDGAGERFFENTPFHATTRMLEQWLGREGGGDDAARLERLEQALAAAGLKLNEALPLVAELLNLPVPPSYAAPLLAPEQKRRRLFATLAAWLFGAARPLPMAIAFEDLHWADPSTLEWIQLLAEQGATAPVLLLCTARPEFRAPWPMRSHHAQLTLNRLSERQVRDLIANVAGASLPADTVAAVVARTTGVPLFVEELTRAVLDTGVRDAKHDIPITLHDSLMARLDRLGPAKEIAQIGSVIGRQFEYSMLQAVAAIPDAELQSELAKLCDAELLYAQGFAPDAIYTFKHALIHDAAYEALSNRRRRELHRRTAETICERFKELADAQPERLARHWAEAGDTAAAIAAWSAAGDSARRRYAFKEAEEGYRQALALVGSRPDSGERDALELQLTSSLLLALSVTRGYAAPDTVNAAARAQQLAEKTGNYRRLFAAVTGAGNAAVSAGDYQAAAELADQALGFARREGSAAYLAIAHRLQLEARFYRGDLPGAERFFTNGARFFADARFKRAAGGLVSAFGHGAFVAWVMGRADVARERSREAMAHANAVNGPFDQAFALDMESVLQMQMRDPRRAQAAAEAAIELSDKHGFRQYSALARIPLGWAQAQAGAAAEGVAAIREGLEASAKTGTRVALTLFLVSLAEAYARAGAIPEALDAVGQALQANPHEVAWQPQALAVRGELQMALGKTELGEADLRSAIALARRMQARSLELRASIALARFLGSQGKRDEARATLRAIYEWFTEGFDTADVVDARTLLDQLAE